MGQKIPTTNAEYTTNPISVLSEEARAQARYYLQQIEKDEDRILNLWALATLCETNTETQNFIDRSVADSDLGNTVPLPFCNNRSKKELFRELAIRTESAALYFAYFLEAGEDERMRIAADFSFSSFSGKTDGHIDFSNLMHRIVQKRPFDGISISTSTFSFLHYLLISEVDLIKDGILSEQFQNNIQRYLENSDFKTEPPSLRNSLKLVTLFRILYRKYDYEGIYPLYESLINDRLFPLSTERMNIYRYLAFSMYPFGLYDRSLYVSRNFTLPLVKFVDLPKKELSALHTHGVFLYQIGKIRDAQAIYRAVLDRSEELGVNLLESDIYNNLAITYLKIGNFDRYLDLQFKALEAAKKQNNYSHQLKVYKNLHIVSRRKKDIKSAYNYLMEAKELAEQHGSMSDLASINISLATYYRDMVNNDRRALATFNKVDSLIQTINDASTYNLVKQHYPEKAYLFTKNNDFSKALNTYNQLIRLASNKNDIPALLEASVEKAKIFLSQGKLDSVETVLAQLNSEKLQQVDFQVIVKARTLEAGYLIQKGRKQKAYNVLEPVIEQVVERVRSSTDIESGYWNVEKEYLDAFQVYVDLLIETDRHAKAVLALDRLKTINDAELYQNPMVKSSHLNETELTQYQRLTTQLNQLRKQQLSTSNVRNLTLQSQIDHFSAQKRALDRKISRYADQEPITMQQVQQKLRGTDVALHITELKNRYYIATITRRSIEFRQFELNKQIRSLFEGAVRELSRGETDLGKLYRIGEILQLSQLPSYADNIILIPDSYLYQLPLDIIPLSEPNKNYSYGAPTYLIERFKTEYLTSLNELKPGEKKDREYDYDYAGFGISEFDNPSSSLIPLPYARYEVAQSSKELYNLKTHKTILDENSTETTFRTIAPKARIIHLATHSKVSEQDPLFSTIYMSNPGRNNEEDRFNSQIFAYELFEMNLSNELIMLNSCESGSGSYLQGSGIVGISRALRYAGAESLILNLWSVNDMMASDFAVQFYKALNGGASKSEALRKAKLHFLKKKNANPHYWGPYMLIGNKEAVVEPYQTANILFATGFMVYLIVLVILSYLVQLKREGKFSSF